ncbi:AMP-binding protein [Halomonas beimenensis]|uniref:AMP-binding protein n=1 Tax=Halomonas beimenensis TaxID=475662 RepID=UPI001D0F40F0|nr:AMP-binding protein [Halomonas beimenensis]
MNESPEIDEAGLLEMVSALVKEIHADHSAPEALTLDSRLERDLGLDSLARVELIARVEAAYRLSLPERTYTEVETPRDLLRVLKARAPSVPAAMPEITPSPRERLEAPPPERARTLVEVLEWHARHSGERVHIRFYRDRGDGETLRYRQLHETARRVAAALQLRGLEPGGPVVIMLPTGADYFMTFFGILMAGGIPVPIYPPARPSQLEEHMRRHARILANCRARLLVSVSETRQAARLLKGLAPDLRHVLTAPELRDAPEPASLPEPCAEDIALLQYTSGSTGHPKGVMLSHANLLANIRAMGRVIEGSSRDVFVSWLPLYHDMGLIGAWLGSLYHAALLVVMSPLTFLARPERWLRAIERHGGTLSASPNFGYEYTLHRLRDVDLAGLDLGSWRAAFNGAEAISPVTLDAFLARFAPHGFRAEAMTPVYGLAESSVGLTLSPLDRRPVIDRVQGEALMRRGRALPAGEGESALRFVSCGTPLPGHQIRVVGPAGNELPERQEGRLEFQGPSSTTGYYREPSTTRELFDGEWLATGDLAYIADGELFVTGRSKDIIIRAGRNIYPDELEKAIGDITGIRKGCVAIFGASDPRTGTERLIVLAETRLEGAEPRRRLRERVNDLAADLIGTPPDEVVLAPPGSVLKTSSGKIRRSASREMYEKGDIGPRRRALPWQVARLSLRAALPQARRLGRLLMAALYAFHAWVVGLVILPAGWLAIVAAPTLEGRWRLLHGLARTWLKLTRTKLTVRGREHFTALPRQAVLVVNHASYVDGLMLAAALDSPVRFVAKAEFRGAWWARLPLERLGTAFVERFDVGRSVADARRLGEELEAGKRLAFFAEGTFTRIPGLRPFHLGAFQAAAAAGAPVLPIALRGTRSILRSGSWFPHHGAVTVTIGEAIEPDAGSRSDDASNLWTQALSLRTRARRFILRHCGEPDLDR